MAKKTFYIPDEEVPLYEKAKALAGESISSVIVEAIKGFVCLKEMEAKQMSRITLQIGTVYIDTQEFVGRKVEFIGRELGKDNERDTRQYSYACQTLYYSAKGNFVIQSQWQELHGDELIYGEPKPYKSIRDMRAAGVSIHLLKAAETNVPEPVEMLDI